MPRSPHLFLVSHADGTIMLYDKEKEDGNAQFTPSDPDALTAAPTNDREETPTAWDPAEDILVSRPPWHPTLITTAPDPRKVAVKNPLSHWRVSRRAVHGELPGTTGGFTNRCISGFVFSPDLQYIAVVSEDGCLRIVDALNER